MSRQHGYREYVPPPPLASVVDRVWTREAMPPHGAEFDVLPDGAVDVMTTVHPDGSLGTPFVVGAMTRPERLNAPDIGFLGIRFLPGAAGAVLGVPQWEITDQQAEIGELVGARSSRLVSDALQRLVQSTRDNAALDNATLVALIGQLAPRPRPIPHELRVALAEMVRTTGRSRVAYVATSLRVTRQHLARLFAHHVGLTPKVFAEICRVRALLSLKAHSARPWSQLAAQFGYSDQSHLIAAVHRVTGQTPTSWQSKANSISPIPMAPDP